MSKNEQPIFSDWYVTHSPKTFDEVFGQDTIVNYLRTKIKKNEFDKSTLFVGQFGSGKTVLAKILAKAIACKNKDEKGNPCNSCATCIAVNNETWDRDVIYLNGEQMSAQEVEDILNKQMLAPAIRDAAKVFIVDETQGLSAAAIQRFLTATQSPRKGVFFIFTAMSKLAGKNPGALQSRCKQWKMKVPTNQEIYNYLVKFSKDHDLIKDAGATKEFWTEGLQFIAENSESSFRKAIQMFQQCIDGKIFDKQLIRDTFDIVSYDDACGILADISHGQISKRVFDTVCGADYQDKFGLLVNIIGDAATLKTFGLKYIEESEVWKWKNAMMVAEGNYFDLVCESFQKLGLNNYIRRGDWKIEISNLLRRITQTKETEESDKARAVLDFESDSLKTDQQEKKIVRRRSTK